VTGNRDQAEPYPTRSHQFSVPIRTTPEELWRALTDAEQLIRWYSPAAKVVPGEGGSIWGSWGEGVEGEMPIEVWDPGRHLRLRLGSQTIDYLIESHGAATVLRLVHSGFGADASFDEEFESTRGGWTTFLKMLQHALERHPGVPAQNVSITRRTGVSPAEAWKRIAATGALDQGSAVPGHPQGYGGFVVPALNDSYLAVFCEGKGSALVTITWVLYGLPASQVEQVRGHWRALVDRLFPPVGGGQPGTA